MHEIIPVKMGIIRVYEYTGFPLKYILRPIRRWIVKYNIAEESFSINN
jgi:hypothetical protein